MPRRLEVPELSSNRQLGDTGAVALAHGEHLGGLLELGLIRCDLGERGQAALQGSPMLRESLRRAAKHLV